MKGVAAPLLAIAVAAALVGLLAWVSSRTDDRERELAWIEAHAAWSVGVERDLRASRVVEAGACAERFDAEVGPPPTGRLRKARRAGRARCLEGSTPATWRRSRWAFTAALVDVHTAGAEATLAPRLSEIASGIAGRRTRVYCWPADDWEPLSEQYGAVRGDEFRLAGLADPERGRIELEPDSCERLRAFVRGEIPPPLSGENLDLAGALVLLAHEAEHVRVPSRTEAEVECYALQRVRTLARSAELGRTRQDELAGLALDYSYPYLPEDYRTKRCRDGGPLDLNPGTSVWP